MIIIPSNVMAAPSDPFFSNTVLLLKTVGVGGASNSAFRDDSANNFVPVRNGDVTQGGLSPYVPTGYWSNYFDGSGDWFYASSNAAFGAGTGAYTVEMWIFPFSWSNNYVPLFRNGTTTNGISFSKGYQANTLIVNNVGVGDMITSNVLPAVGQWSHVVAVRSGTTLSIFVNGVRTATATSSVNHPASDLYIGGYSDMVNSPFHGHISNVRYAKAAVYDPTLTTLAVPTEPLTSIANTSVLTCQDNRFIDRSTNNFALTRNGDVSVQRFAPFGIANTVTTHLAATGSVTFDGNGDYLTVGPNAALAPGSGNFTYECWINSSAPNNSPIMESRAVDGSTGGFTLTALSSTQIRIFTNSAVATATVASYAGAWTHVAVVKSGSTTTLYVNGVAGATTTSIGTLGDTDLIIGGGRYSGSNPVTFSFPGFISNFRYTKNAVYTGNFTPPTTPLTVVTGTSLLTCQDSSTVTDASTNNFTITRVGDAKASEVSPFKRSSSAFGGSAYFDGSGDYLNFTNNVAFNQTADFSMDCWAYCTGNTANGTYQYFGSGDGNPYMELGLNGSGYFAFVKGYVGDLITSNGQAGVARAGQWYHVAATRVSNVCRLFVNGVLQGTATDSTSMAISGNNPYQVGALANGLYPFTGYIAGFRFVRGGIPSAFSTTSTTAGAAVFTPPTSPPSLSDGLTGGSVSLLLNFDNAGITDATAGSVSRTVGDAKTSTTVTLFGGSTMYFDGTGDYLRVFGGNFMAFGTAEFCIEMWAWSNTASGLRILYEGRSGVDSAPRPTLGVDGTTLFYYTSGSTRITGTLPANQWCHIALCRGGTTTRLFVNGVQQGSFTDATNYTNETDKPLLGAVHDSTGLGGNGWNGYISDVRVTRAARYTSNFTPPTTELPTR